LIGIITDSTCDIPEDLIEQYGIIVIPHLIIWGNDQYRDRVDIKPVEFYERFKTDPQRPTSSQAAISDFQNAIETAASRGATEAIILTVSSAMSGAYNMALNAAKIVKIPVSVVDAKGPTMSLGWQVLAAARACTAGMNLNAVLKVVDQVRSKMVQFVGMESLEYLQKGGRIGDAIKWVGGLLQVKPLVSINHITGRVEPVSLARTSKGMAEGLYTRFISSFKGEKNIHVAVLHGNCEEKAKVLAEQVQRDLNPVELMINITGPVLGINTGPGALAMCGYAEG